MRDLAEKGTAVALHDLKGWQAEFPGLPPKSEPEQLWWFYGTQDDRLPPIVSLVRVIRAGSGSTLHTAYNMEGMFMYPSDGYIGVWKRAEVEVPEITVDDLQELARNRK